MSFYDYFIDSVFDIMSYFGQIANSFAFELIFGVFLCFSCACILILPFMVLRFILSFVGGSNG